MTSEVGAPLNPDELDLPSNTQRGSRNAARIAAGLLAATAVLGFAGHKASTVPVVSRNIVSPRPQLLQMDEEEDPCHNLPYFRVTGIKSNNLGEKGPDKGAPEGIVYGGEAHIDGVNSTIEVHVNAASEAAFDESNEEEQEVTYSPQWATKNGITGNFGTINLRPGTNLTVKLHAYDVQKQTVVTLPQFAMTFFDMDAGRGGERSIEWLRVKGFSSYYISNETEINVTDEGDGSMMFKATKEGTGDDNPDHPLELTELQKNRAVSFTFADTKEVLFEMGCTEGLTGRVFMFVLRPALRCAYTKLEDGTLVDADDPNNPIRIAKGSAYRGPAMILASVLAFLSLRA